MSEEKENNDPIENFFKEKSSNYEIPYEEKDWQKLKQRLDKTDAIYYRRRRMKLAAAVLALLLAVLGYFTYQNHIKLNHLIDQNDEQQITETEDNGSGDQTRSQEAGTLNSGEKEKRNAGSINPDQPERIERNAVTKADKRSNELTREIHQKESPVPNWTVTGPEIDALFVSEIGCADCTVSSFPIGNELRGVKNRTATSARIAAEAFAPNMDRSLSALKKPHIALGFVFAPNLSTVGGLSHFDSPGYKVGLTAEIGLSKRLSITTGAIHSNVNYEAHGRQYKPPRGYWDEGIVAQKTFAECTLIDIPINIKYDILQFDRGRLFATAGVASYIMLSENYRFQYENYNPDAARQWSGNTGTRHWFSNAGFSIGYEVDIHSNWGLQIEPFIRMPLKEVGWGNVKLYSVGTFISLNYKLGNF